MYHYHTHLHMHTHTSTHSVTVFNTYTPSWLLMHFLQNRSFFSLWKKTGFFTSIFKSKYYVWMRFNRSENPKPRRSLHQPWPHIISPNQHQIHFDKVRRKSTGVEDTLDVSLPAPQDTHTHTTTSCGLGCLTSLVGFRMEFRSCTQILMAW